MFVVDVVVVDVVEVVMGVVVVVEVRLIDDLAHFGTYRQLDFGHQS